jgi:DNA invertase Pin-like site-specific DNA recombinase
MLERCKPHNPYGRLGIEVCERWQIFANFLADMGERPAGTELDRLRSAGNYEPGNCQWTPKRQNRQYRRTAILTPEKRAVILELRKAGLTRQAIADQLGVSLSCIRDFLSGAAWRPVDVEIPRPPSITVAL